jgi:hypothetical protein
MEEKRTTIGISMKKDLKEFIISVIILIGMCLTMLWLHSCAA